MKAIRILVLSMIALLLAPLCALCTGEALSLELPPEEEQFQLGGLDSDEAFEGYVNQLFGIEKPRTLFRAVRLIGDNLTGKEKVAYTTMKAEIAKVAAGDRASTIFELTAEALGLDGKYYADDLGVNSVVSGKKISDAATTAMRALEAVNTGDVFRALLRDCPYEMYWCDKTSGASATTFGVGIKMDSDRQEYYLFFTGTMKFKFSVAEAFSAGEYTVDTAIAQTAAAAAGNALGVVEAYANENDFDKLKSYKNWICDHVNYNHSAAAGGVSYGNPWQMIWVFDDDDETKVVCEGYAKAFQYLCARSDFASDIDCRMITGRMGGENHMWNIVQMGNGKNYLVDVTNCDQGSIGYPDKLFLVGTANGNVEDGYTMNAGKGVLYTYDDNTRSLFSDALLTLSTHDYIEENVDVPIDEAHFPDAAFRAFVKRYDGDQGDALSEAECAAVVEMDCSGLGIGDLSGIEYFGRLTALDCSDNNIESLPLDDFPGMTSLQCGHNALAQLDISGISALTALVSSENLVFVDGVAEYRSGNDCLAFDVGVRLIRGNAALQTLRLPGDTRAIEDEAFAGASVERVEIPEGCERIGARAFADCDSLVEVWMPKGISAGNIADSAFEGSAYAFVVTDDPEIQAWAVAHGMLWVGA